MNGYALQLSTRLNKCGFYSVNTSGPAAIASYPFLSKYDIVELIGNR